MKIELMKLHKQPKVFCTIGACAMLAAATLLSGCAGTPRMTLDTVGPAPTQATAIMAAKGSLVVFSDTETVYDSDLPARRSFEHWTPSSYTWQYSGYKIFSADGKFIKFVKNNSETTLLHPQQVDLPAGKYCVAADSQGYGRIAVPVVISASKVTVVHLDATGFQPGEYGLDQTNTVQLPDGRIVGWRASTDAVRL